MDTNKETQYRNLVESRKKCRLCKSKPDYELLNASSIQGGKFDSEELGPWSLWHADLNAAVLIIGKDFGSAAYFANNHGFDKISNPTNSTLASDFVHAGASLKLPKHIPYVPEKRSGFFFSNSVLCLAKDCKDQKNESMKTKIYPEWIKTCSQQFLRDLIGIIAPKIIIPVGKEALYAVAVALDKQTTWGIDDSLLFNLTSKVEHSIPLHANETLVYPVFHPSHRHINRPPELNKSDWSRIRKELVRAFGNET